MKKGITLISLVITIILLLILAAVAVNLAVDGDGLFAKAKEAATDHNTAVEAEAQEINNLLNMFEAMTKCSHTWENGTCSKCGEVCEHAWSNGECSKCGLRCNHTWVDGVCSNCGFGCNHTWSNGTCGNCGLVCGHTWENGLCSNCGFECNHTWTDGVCGNCGMNCSHTWNEGTCSTCSKVCTHTWVDGNCSICGMQGVSSVTISGANTVEVKSTTTLTASYDIGTPATGELQWTSSNPEVATVDQNGVVTGVCSTQGTTTIKATYLKNNSVYGEIVITVNPSLVGECNSCGIYISGSYVKGWCDGVWYWANPCTMCRECGNISTLEPEELGGHYWLRCDSCPDGDGFWHVSLEEPDSCPQCGGTLSEVSLMEGWYKLECGHETGGTEIIGKCEFCEDGFIYDYGE